MKFLVNEGLNPRISTDDFKDSTVMRRSAAVRHMNGVNVSKMAPTSVSDDPGRGGF